MSYESFSSLPPEEERHFVVFEEFTQSNAKRATVIGWVSALGFGALVVAIVAMYWGTAPKAALEEEAEESAAVAPAPAPAPTPPPAPAPAAAPDPAAAGAAPAADPAAAPAAPAAPAGAVPPGATKAPPAGR